MRRPVPILITVLLLLMGFMCQAQVSYNNNAAPLDLNAHMEYAVTDGPALLGNEKWYSSEQSFSHTPKQYVHFRVSIKNEFAYDIPLWFSIGFPAIKYLTVQDGKHTWITGDALPFGTRPIKTPDYHFPTTLKSLDTIQLYGHMQGEILRHVFTIGTPEYAVAQYRDTLQRDMTFFGAMSILVVMCVVIFLVTRNHAYLSFAAFALAVEAWFFRIFGYSFELLWPNYPQFNDISYAICVYALMMSPAWIMLAGLKRKNTPVTGAKSVVVFTLALPVIGLIVWRVAGLDAALQLPLLWFFPASLFAGFIMIQEHRKGSDKAKWLAAALLPVMLGSMLLILFVLGVDIYLDPVTVLMQGIVATCFLMTLLTSTYLVRVLQRERDTEKATSKLKTEQAQKLEELVKARTQALENSNLLLQELASKDGLTDLPNRRSVDLFVDSSFEQDNENLAIALVDLDHFKQINDTYGHDVGDVVLYEVANLLRPLNTENCIAGRFGGEEFAIVHRQISANRFAEILQDFHTKMNMLQIEQCPNRPIKACIGWTICERSDQTVDAFRRADQALYQAKDKGRNLIIHSH